VGAVTLVPTVSSPGEGHSPAASCAVCESSDLEPRYRVADAKSNEEMIPTTTSYGVALANIVRCRRCGHMQLQAFPEDAELAESYAGAASEDYVEEEAGQRATARTVLEAIERHAPRGRLLDLGCWVGFTLSEAERRGWNGVGIEPSEFAADYARRRLGLDVRRGELLDAELEPASFDAVFMGDVIEHLPGLSQTLGRVSDVLVSNGVLAMTLPDAGSRVARAMGRRWWSVIPTHVHYFTRASMRTLLERGGYEVLQISTAPKAFTVRYYLERLSGYREGAARALVRGAERIGLADRLWAPDFRDRMLVVARRR
jgi:SAM-dependent methyltransferase